MEHLALRVFIRGAVACGLILFAHQAQGSLLINANSSIPLATYTLSFTLDDAPTQTISNTVVPNTVASIIKSGNNSTGAAYTGRASADTGQASTSTPILVSVQGEVDAQQTAPAVTIGLTVNSVISYYFRVVQTAPAPVDVVRLLIHSNLHADASASGTGGAPTVSAGFSILDLNIFHSETAMCVATICMSPSEMSFTDSASATAGQDIQVQITAGGTAGAASGFLQPSGHATFQAIADPTIEIDPNFAYADDFTVVFSPNLPSLTAAPEPSSIVMLAIGLLALMALVRSNELRRRFED